MYVRDDVCVLCDLLLRFVFAEGWCGKAVSFCYLFALSFVVGILNAQLRISACQPANSRP